MANKGFFDKPLVLALMMALTVGLFAAFFVYLPESGIWDSEKPHVIFSEALYRLDGIDIKRFQTDDFKYRDGIWSGDRYISIHISVFTMENRDKKTKQVTYLFYNLGSRDCFVKSKALTWMIGHKARLPAGTALAVIVTLPPDEEVVLSKDLVGVLEARGFGWFKAYPAALEKYIVLPVPKTFVGRREK